MPQQQLGPKSLLRCDGCRGATVIALNPAARQQRIGSLLLGLCDEKFELSHLVSCYGDTGQIVSLAPQRRPRSGPKQRGKQRRLWLQWRRRLTKRSASERNLKRHARRFITPDKLRAMRALAVSAVLSCLGCDLSSVTTDDAASSPADMTAAAPVSAQDWLPRSVGYEIFVRSFADSSGDGQGDLEGIRQRLPYLQSLGVNLLWLTPIHPSPSYHGYDVTDYDAVHPDFGTLADFDRLLADAHQRKIRVLLDLVVNHTSKAHPWFLQAKDSPTGSGDSVRYLFRANDPGWMWQGSRVFRPLDGQPGRYYYGLFSPNMPDVNLRDPATVSAMEAVAQRWLLRGVDGFRLDAARYLIESPDPIAATMQPGLSDTTETHQLWQTFRRDLTQQSPSSALIGEVWSDADTIASYHGGGKELHGAFHFPLSYAIIDGVKRGTARPIRDLLEKMASGGVPVQFFAPFLTNHDQKRLATELGNDQSQLRTAATLLLGMPGTPFLYYGEEIGLAQSTASGDRGQRPAMPWDVVQKQSESSDSLLAHYRRLGQLRQAEPGLHKTALQVLWPATPDDRMLAIFRGDSASGVVLIVNVGTSPLAGVKLSLPSDYRLGVQRELLSGAPVPVVTVENRSAYPLPTIAPRGALWIAPSL